MAMDPIRKRETKTLLLDRLALTDRGSLGDHTGGKDDELLDPRLLKEPELAHVNGLRHYHRL